jgi:DNA-binding transcriptional ArsR family regulator
VARSDRAASKYGALAAHLETLASETRLELLHALRVPRTLSEIRVGATLTRGDESPDRPLARQSVAHHIDQLVRQGLVVRVPGEGSGRGDTYVLNHERLFALVDEMRSLAKLRPVTDPVAEPSRTAERVEDLAAALPEGPRLLVAYGRDDGRAFGLTGPVGKQWRLGRSSACEVCLDYDPYSSSVHALVVRDGDGYTVIDQGSRNGTAINWILLPPQQPRRLRAGDVLTVGRTVLVFQS